MVQNKNIFSLDKISKKEKSDTIKNVSDTLLLLQGNEIPEEIKILKQIGLDNHIQKAERADNNLKRFTAFEVRYGRNVYSGEQVKKHCEASGYKIVRVDLFPFEVPLEVGKAIIDFSKEHTVKHQHSEERVIERSNINLQASNFFLLTSIQSMNGAPVKAATLFYREEYDRDYYDKVTGRDMLVEVHSWGKPGNERSLFWYYAKASDYLVLFPCIFILLGVLCLLLSENSHGILLFLAICSSVAILSFNKKTFFKWN